MDKGFWTASLFLLLLGLACIAAGVILTLVLAERSALKGHTVARVVDLQLREDPHAGNKQFRHCFYPVLEYYADGKLYKQVYPKGSYPSVWKVNQAVKLDYDPEDPNIYALSDQSMRKRLPAVLSAAGILMVVTASMFFLRFATRT